MKKIILIAAAALAGLAASAQPKFAHVNFQEIVQLMPEMDSARTTMELVQNETQEIYTSMMQEFQTKYQQFEQKQASWTPAVRESKQRELGEIQNRLQEFEQSAQQDLQAKQQELMAPIYQKAQGAVNDIAKKQGFIYVFDASQILYIDPAQSTDITKDARTALGIPEGRTIETLQAELQAKAATQQQ